MTFAHTGRAVPGPVARGRGDGGETLIEVLVAIMLMGIAFTAILSALYTSARVAQINQRNSKASIALQGLAEQLLQPARGTITSTYIPCATGSIAGPVDSYKDSVPNIGAVPAGWSWNVVRVRYAKDPTPIVSDPNIYQVDFTRSKASCDSLGDTGLQELTLEITNNSLNTNVTKRIIIVKRDRSCPATFSNADKGPC